MPALGEIERRRKVAELHILQTILRNRAAQEDPSSFGLPNLMRPREPYEDQDTFLRRQEEELADFIERTLYIVKDGVQIRIILIPEMLRMIVDCVYGRKRRAILWKPRGSGGSLAVAVILWLCLIYRNMSFTLMAGSGDQAKILFDYVRDLWNCHPTLRDAFLDREPTVTEIVLKNGAKLKAVTATEKASRGKHTRGLVIDEACLLPGTYILTDSGMQAIENVVEGDRVWTKDGRFRKVLATSSKFREDWPCRTIRPLGGLPISTTAEHEWMDASGQWREARTYNLKDRLHFARPSERTEFERPEWLTTLDGWRFAGWYLGNGHREIYDIAVTVGKGKSEYHDHLFKVVREIFKVEPTTCDERDGSYRIRFSPGKHIVNEISDLCGRRSKEKGLPVDLLLSVTKEEIYQLVLGLIETDGCFSQEISTTGGRCDSIFYRTSSDKLAMNFYLICSILGWPIAIKRRTDSKPGIKGRVVNSGPSWEFVLSGQTVYDVAHEFDLEFTDQRTKKPKSRIEVDNELLRSRVFKIEEFEYTGLVYDLTVEEDHSFAAPYATLHNSQKDYQTNEAIKAALQGPKSEQDSLIILVSTFHNPSGLFQDHWDYADDKGFERYKWNIIDAMVPCRLRVDCRTCFLTELEPVRKPSGEIVEYQYKGCAGKGRTSVGWKPVQEVFEAKRENIGSNVFAIEYLCERPEYGQTVYNLSYIRRAQELCPKNQHGESHVPWTPEDTKALGIDWGYKGQTALVLVNKTDSFVGVIDVAIFQERSLRDIIQTISRWHTFYMPERKLVPIYADSSHSFNNLELHELGYDVNEVPFVRYKDFGIENVSRYLAFGRLLFHKGNRGDGMSILWEQMNNYRRNRLGKPVKENDHTCDALMCAMLEFPYTETFSDQDISFGSAPVQAATISTTVF